MDLRPFQCAQFLGGLKLLKLGNFVDDDTRPGRPKTSVTKAKITAVKVVVKQAEKAFGPKKGLRYVGTSFAHWGAKDTTP